MLLHKRHTTKTNSCKVFNNYKDWKCSNQQMVVAQNVHISELPPKGVTIMDMGERVCWNPWNPGFAKLIYKKRKGLIWAVGILPNDIIFILHHFLAQFVPYHVGYLCCLMSSDVRWHILHHFLAHFVPYHVGYLCCLMSSDVRWHIRDKLRPMPKHGSI